VLDVNLGFQPERVAVLRVEPSGPTAVDDRPKWAFYTDIIRRVQEIPGVEAAAVTDALPLDRNRTWSIAARGQLREQGRSQSMFVRVISAGYFATMKIPIKQGEDFPFQANPANKELVVIINETTARTLWPGQNPIGRYAVIQGNDHRVIGVVADVRHTSLEETSGIEAYLPITQYGPAGSADLVMRTSMQPTALAASLRGAVRAVDPMLPTTDVRIMQDLVDKAVSPRRFIMWLLTAFAAQALVLACLGIYGVVSYSVTERTREIGIRMALGASRGDVQRRVLRETLTLAAVGAVLGFMGALAAARIITSLLFGLSSTDPATFGGMIAVLTAVALIAGYIPARRASRIDAMAALRAS
jgi:predicted permease